MSNEIDKKESIKFLKQQIKRIKKCKFIYIQFEKSDNKREKVISLERDHHPISDRMIKGITVAFERELKLLLKEGDPIEKISREELIDMEED